MSKEESKEYLSKQIITYLGNKRGLLKEIESFIILVTQRLGKTKLITADLFSGSGVVARLLKKYSSKIIANDLESYSYVLNNCYLSNKSEFSLDLFNKYLNEINKKIEEKPINGVIRKHYSPKNDKKIEFSDRAFYTNKNATYIDSFRYYIDKVVPNEYKKYFLSALLIEASIHVNTCGVFKGFYKDTGIGKFGGKAENSLSRICSEIKIKAPVLSEFESEYQIYQEDANLLARRLKGLDLVYLDPPYNQHPYGSNYFMLNTILNNKASKNVSKVSGIPDDWNHSIYNSRKTALDGMKDLISNLDAKFILISYNNEGFISYNDMEEMLKGFGKVSSKQIGYYTFRGSRNLNNRDLYTREYLFLLEKEK